MQVGQELVSCAYVSSGDSGITQAKFDTSNQATGYLAVTVVADNETTSPTPNVELASTANKRVYGALVTFNSATGRCGIQRTGIAPFKANGVVPNTDLGTGVVGFGVAGPPNTMGQVDAGTGGDGTGTVIGRTGSIAWVDLDAEQAKV